MEWRSLICHQALAALMDREDEGNETFGEKKRGENDRDDKQLRKSL